MSSERVEIEVDGVIQLAAVYRSPFLQTGGVEETDPLPLQLPLTLKGVGSEAELVVDVDRARRRVREPPDKAFPNYGRCAERVALPLAEWPDIWRASARFMAGTFKNGRLRYCVALIAVRGVARSLRQYGLRNPTDVELAQAKSAVYGLSEGELLGTFTGYTWGEAEYRTRFLMPARSALLNADWRVPSQDRPADELTTDEQCLVVTDDEWRAIQVWCHRLWFLLRPQLIK